MTEATGAGGSDSHTARWSRTLTLPLCRAHWSRTLTLPLCGCLLPLSPTLTLPLSPTLTLPLWRTPAATVATPSCHCLLVQLLLAVPLPRPLPVQLRRNKAKECQHTNLVALRTCHCHCHCHCPLPQWSSEVEEGSGGVLVGGPANPGGGWVEERSRVTCWRGMGLGLRVEG